MNKYIYLFFVILVSLSGILLSQLPSALSDEEAVAIERSELKQLEQEYIEAEELADKQYEQVEVPSRTRKRKRRTPKVIRKTQKTTSTSTPKKNSPSVYLDSYTEPWRDMNPDEKISMQFDNADLVFLLDYLERAFNITFILDDNIKPPSPNARLVSGNKVTFKSQVPLNRQQIWELGNTFLEMAGLAIVPLPTPRTYRVMASAAQGTAPSANREPLPTFIGTDIDSLPQTGKIRYVYFVENADTATIKSVVDAMKSASSGPALVLEPMRALIMTDQAANIRSLLTIISEIDQVTMPETLSVIRLKQTDANKVFELYKQLIQPADQQAGYLFRPARRAETTSYFSKNLRIIPEPRTNSLIALGTRDTIKRFEDFIFNEIDKPITLPFSPLHIHQLRYLKAPSIAAILNDVIKFQQGEPAAQFGGVRGGEKYFRIGTTITPEPDGNRLIINAPYDDYLKILEVLEKMDVEQPQVAIKVLILNVDITDTRALASQLRNKSCITDATGTTCSTDGCCGPNGLLGQNINFQTSGFQGIGAGTVGILENTTPNSTGAVRLLADLVALASGNNPGTTLITLGRDMFGIFGILRILQTYTRTSVVANPFLVATHKYKAFISLGETRRLRSAIVSGVGGNVDSFTDVAADLSVELIPQISFVDNMISMDILVTFNQFTDVLGSRNNKVIRTNALLANGEVLALGGLIKDNVTEEESKVPILGDIPIIGSLFFKSRSKVFTRNSLLILLSPEIIKPHTQFLQDSMTQSKINESKNLLFDMKNPADKRDPIYRWFFRDIKEKESAQIDKFISRQQSYLDETRNPTLSAVALDQSDKKRIHSNKNSLFDLVNPKQETMSGVAA